MESHSGFSFFLILLVITNFFFYFFFSLCFLVLSSFPQCPGITSTNRKKKKAVTLSKLGFYSFYPSPAPSPCFLCLHGSPLGPSTVRRATIGIMFSPLIMFSCNLHFHHVVYQESGGPGGCFNSFPSSEPLTWMTAVASCIAITGTASEVTMPGPDCKLVWQQRARSRARVGHGCMGLMNRGPAVPLGLAAAGHRPLC